MISETVVFVSGRDHFTQFVYVVLTVSAMPLCFVLCNVYRKMLALKCGKIVSDSSEGAVCLSL